MSSCNEKNMIIRRDLTTCKKTPFSGSWNRCRLNSNWYKKSKLFIFFIILNNIFHFFTSKFWLYGTKFNPKFSFFQLSYIFFGFSWNHGQFQTSFTETAHGFKGKPLIFFFLYDGFSETWANICGFTCSGGWKLETNGGFIETGGFGDVKGRRPFTSPKSPSFNEYHHWFSSFHTPKTREYHIFSPKFHWIPSYK